jgi:hypothetical protein
MKINYKNHKDKNKPGLSCSKGPSLPSNKPNQRFLIILIECQSQ